MKKQICPYCNSVNIIAKITRGAIARFVIMDDETLDMRISEESKEFEYEVLGCKDCGNKFTEKELSIASQCSKCGKYLPENLLDESRICDVCNIANSRPELLNATKEELIRMLLMAEKGFSPIERKIEKKLQNAEKTIESIDTKLSQNEESNQKEEIGQESEQRKARKIKRKEKTEQQMSKETEEFIESITVSESSEQAETSTEDVQNLSEQQEAPFPNVQSDIVNPPAENQNANFPMFDENDEAF